MANTNGYVELQKQKRSMTSKKSQLAVDSGDIQAVIDSLTHLQIRFCEEMVLDPRQQSDAAKRAGYSEKTAVKQGYQLMENQAIRLVIDYLRAQRSKNSDVTKDFVLVGIQKTIRKAEEDGNHNATLRGYELLARHLGMFIEKTEISGPNGDAIRMEQKVNQDANDFASRMARLAKSAGSGSVSKLPIDGSEG